jgi:hypothetical protein
MKATKVSTFLNDAIRRSTKTQKEIARDAGFSRPNILSMLKTGETKMPVARVPAPSRALNVPAAELLRLCLSEYEPEILKVIDEVLPGSLLDKRELELIRAFRSFCEH